MIDPYRGCRIHPPVWVEPEHPSGFWLVPDRELPFPHGGICFVRAKILGDLRFEAVFTLICGPRPVFQRNLRPSIVAHFGQKIVFEKKGLAKRCVGGATPLWLKPLPIRLRNFTEMVETICHFFQRFDFTSAPRIPNVMCPWVINHCNQQESTG